MNDQEQQQQADYQKEDENESESLQHRQTGVQIISIDDKSKPLSCSMLKEEMLGEDEDERHDCSTTLLPIESHHCFFKPQDSDASVNSFISMNGNEQQKSFDDDCTLKLPCSSSGNEEAFFIPDCLFSKLILLIRKHSDHLRTKKQRKRNKFVKSEKISSKTFSKSPEHNTRSTMMKTILKFFLMIFLFLLLMTVSCQAGVWDLFSGSSGSRDSSRLGSSFHNDRSLLKAPRSDALLDQQQVIQPVGKLDLTRFENLKKESNRKGSREAEFERTKSSLKFLKEKNFDALREIEWEPKIDDEVEHARLPLAPRRSSISPIWPTASSQRAVQSTTTRKPFSIPNEFVPLNCERVCVPSNQWQHYQNRNCSRVYSRDCNCVKRFDCSEADIENRKPAKQSPSKFARLSERIHSCRANNQEYSIGETIKMSNRPCNICRCVAKRSSNDNVTTEIDCSVVIECPEMVFGLRPSRPECYFSYTHGQCCGVEICPDQLSTSDVRSSKCRYQNQTYRYGERIFLKENSCKECYCDEKWNSHDPQSSAGCVDVKCQDPELHDPQCTPVYSDSHCCPIDYICKKPSSSSSSISCMAKFNDYSQWCQSNHKSLNYPLTLDKSCTSYGRVCANCQCKIPPFMICQADFQCARNNEDFFI